MKIQLHTISFPDQYFANLKSKASDQRPILTAIGQLMKNAIHENFQTEGSRLGSPWVPLSPKYTRRKIKKYGHKPILQRDQRLLNSIISTEPSVTSNSVAIGTNIVYAPIHHFGGIINIGARSEIFQRLRYKKGSKKGRFKKIKGTPKQGRGFTFRSYTFRIPPRPFMQLTSQDISNISSAISSWLTHL